MSFNTLTTTIRNYFGTSTTTTTNTTSRNISHKGSSHRSDGTTTSNKNYTHDDENVVVESNVWWNIGGPNHTIIPPFMESMLCWTLALSCLSISGYHYIIDNYISRIIIPPKNVISSLLTYGWNDNNYNNNNNNNIVNHYYKIIHQYILYPVRQICFRWCIIPPSLVTTVTATSSSSKSQPKQTFPCWLPIMTYSRAELQRYTSHERYIQLLYVLHDINPNCLCRYNNNNNNDDDNNNNNNNVYCTLSDHEMIQLIRHHEIVRRLVSLALRPNNEKHNKNDDIIINVQELPLGQQLIRIWYQLLILPKPICPIQEDVTSSSSSSSSSKQQQLQIALIIPCYHETTQNIINTLNSTLYNCYIPQRVQVRFIMAGKNAVMDQQQLQLALLNHQQQHHHEGKKWGDIQIMTFIEELGRGPCMNYGTTTTTSFFKNNNNNTNILVYTFCHSDTRLPYHWDLTLMQTLYPSPPPSLSSQTKNQSTIVRSHNETKRINACAYRFGIDTSTLRKNHRRPTPISDDNNTINTNNNNNDYYPPGIHAIEVTANLRCTFWSLPYGDQCISMRATDFHYIGGFPYQCLMEDYELVTLLRKRMKLLSMFSYNNNNNSHNNNNDTVMMMKPEEEILKILPGPPVLCSPRRWQKFGVFYVTYTNSRLVQLYNNKKKCKTGMMTPPEDIYQLYYGQRLDVISPKSPWEIELDGILNKRK